MKPLRSSLTTPARARIAPPEPPTHARPSRTLLIYRGVNAMAESIIGLYKSECITLEGPWRTVEDVELATLSWVHWWNTQRILEPIGDVPPVEFEAAFYAARERGSDANERTAIAAASTTPLRSNMSGIVEVDNASRTPRTLRRAVTTANPETT